jgi:formate hydrogenlyase subunit 4
VAIVIKLGVLGLLLAVLETRVAKLRLFRVPELLALSFTLALLAATSSFFTK